MNQIHLPAQTLPKYSAVILYFRRGRAIERTLSALAAQTHPPTEVIIVDNASGDGVLRDLVGAGRIAADVTVLALQSNIGYSGGMNRGLAALKQPTANVLLLTHEVILEPNCLAELSALSRQAVAVGPTLKVPSGEIWSTGGILTPSGRPKHRSDPILGSSRPARWLDGACILVDKATLLHLGGLDERYFLYWEDVDLGSRLGEVGRVLCSSAGHAQQETATAPIYFDTRNRLQFWRKQHRWDIAIVSTAEAVLKLIFRDIPSGDLARIQARLNGIADGLRNSNRTHRLDFAREN